MGPAFGRFVHSGAIDGGPRRNNRPPQSEQLGPALQRLSGDRPRAVVEHDHGLNRVGFGGVLLGVLTGPDQSFFFPGEEHEANLALGPPTPPPHTPPRLTPSPPP